MKEYKKFLQRLKCVGWNVEYTPIPITKNIGVNEDGTPITKEYERKLYKGTYGILKVNFLVDTGVATFSGPRFHIDLRFGDIKKIAIKEDSKEVIIKLYDSQIGLYFGE